MGKSVYDVSFDISVTYCMPGIEAESEEKAREIAEKAVRKMLDGNMLNIGSFSNPQLSALLDLKKTAYKHGDPYWKYLAKQQEEETV